jgi:ankyrin repeat protein
VAANKGQTETVRLLLEKGADAYVKDMDGRTAMTVAGKEGHGDIVQLLQKAGATQ